MLEILKKIIEEKIDTPFLFKINILKEYLQLFILGFIYSNPKYRSLIFYGGSCLRHCYGIDRLSEDLDFVDIGDNIDVGELGEDLRNFFETKQRLKCDFKVQKFRIVLKFPILYDLGLTTKSESNFLFLKLEIYKEFGFCKGYRIEVIPIFKLGEAILVRTFDISTLMSTKIRAILFRKWEKTSKNGKILANVKGRDYYDLMWYLEKKVNPNLDCIEGINSKYELKNKLIKIIAQVDSNSVKYDLQGLIENKILVEDIGDNIKNILTSLLEKW